MRQVHGFHIGDVLRTALSICARHLPALYLLAWIGYLPAFVVETYYDAESWAAPVCHLASAAWQYSVITYAVVRILRTGQASGLGEVLRHGCLAFPRVLATVVLGTVAIAAGLVLLIVPGIVLMLMYFVAWPAAAVEGGVFSALRRSHELTRGRKGRLFWLLLPIGLLAVASSVLFYALDLPSVLASYLQALLEVAAGAFSVVVAAVAYHDLRVVREGVDSSVAKVFD